MVLFFLVLLHFLAHGHASASATGSQRACQNLQDGSLKSIVSASGTIFEAGATSAWNLLNANLRPDCIVFARTTQDVSAAMETIYVSKANYAVQAGGHSAMQGWNT